MLAILPFLVLILAARRYQLAGSCGERTARSKRESLLASSVFCAIWSAAGSELLSLATEIRFWPVLIWWLLPVLAYGVTSRRTGTFRPAEPDGAAFASGKQAGGPLTWRGKTAIGAAIVVMAYALGAALLSPPNNFDAIAYHMPRIIFWMQQHSLRDFPTSDPLQLCMPPGSEMIGLQLMVLAHGNDWAINLIGWCTALFLGFGSSLICRELDGSRDAQALTGLLVLSMPMVFCSASTFTPEIMEGLWTLIAALYLLRIFRRRKCPPLEFLCLTGAIALMPLTHGTGYIFGLPIAIFAAAAFYRMNRRRVIPAIALIGIVTMALNAGYIVRNIQQFGGPFGPLHSHDPRLVLLNGEFNAQTIPVNLLRTTASMMSGPSHALNILVDKIVFGAAALLHLDIQNPRTMYVYPGVRVYFDGATYHAGNEDRVGWPFQMLLFLLIPVGLYLNRRESNVRACWLFLTLPAAWLILTAAVLRWQAIANHLIPAIPAIVAPVCAIALFGKALQKGFPLFVIGAMAWLLPTALLYPRPLVGNQAVEHHSRDYLLCRDNDQPTRNVQRLCRYLQRMRPQPRLIGLHIRGYMPYTYAILSALDRGLATRPDFVSFNAPYPVKGCPEPDPDVVVGHVGPQSMIHRDTGTVYVCIHKFGFLPLAVFAPEHLHGGSLRMTPPSGPESRRRGAATHGQ